MAPALETLQALPADRTFDFAFIDADKVSYRGYYEALLPRLRTNGLIVFDNVLWMGQVLDADARIRRHPCPAAAQRPHRRRHARRGGHDLRLRRPDDRPQEVTLQRTWPASGSFGACSPSRAAPYLRAALGGAGLALAAPLLEARARAGRRSDAPALLPPDANGVRLLPGFTSRVVARSGEPPTPGGAYPWHPSPDGGAVFKVADRGWVYVSNSEIPNGGGGVGALRFDADGAVVEAYPILRDTTLNCAGGATPWNTWLSCEEFPLGRVWECDPFGKQPAVARPALGVFAHEAAAVDPVGQAPVPHRGRAERSVLSLHAANGPVVRCVRSVGGRARGRAGRAAAAATR